MITQKRTQLASVLLCVFYEFEKLNFKKKYKSCILLKNKYLIFDIRNFSKYTIFCKSFCNFYNVQKTILNILCKFVQIQYFRPTMVTYNEVLEVSIALSIDLSATAPSTLFHELTPKTPTIV